MMVEWPVDEELCLGDKAHMTVKQLWTCY